MAELHDKKEDQVLPDAEAVRRMALAMGLLPKRLREQPPDARILHLADQLLAMPAVWEAVQRELAAKTPKNRAGAKPKRTTDRLCMLARAFDAYKVVSPNCATIGDQVLVPHFRRAHPKFDWLPKSNKTAADWIREGRRLLAAKRLIRARRACLAFGSTKDLFEDEQKSIRSGRLAGEELQVIAAAAEVQNEFAKRALLASIGIFEPIAD
jgi:hypothetical protein